MRLVFPISFTSTFSSLSVINPGMQQTSGALAYVPYNMGLMQTPSIDVGVDGINKAVNSSLPQAVLGAGVNPMQIVIAILSIVWVVGVAVLSLYSVISYLKVINKVKTSTLVRDNIFETDRIVTPFVCGFKKPKIYIPTDISQNELSYILAHERVHIKRLDYLIKPFAFLVLSVHWFNPLMWFSFFLMSKDLEMSCDESVLKSFGAETRANYSHSLLALATGQRQLLSGSPLAFGESNAKARIKNILNYKKRPFWVLAAALIATVALVGLFTANPKNNMIPQVSILTDKESLAFDPLKSSFQGFNMTPNFKNGNATGPVQYRWSVTEGDFIIMGDHSKEVVNNGESLFWWPNLIGSSSTYDIKLKVEEIKTSKVLAETTLTIERNDQVFKVNKLNKQTSIKLNNENVDNVATNITMEDQKHVEQLIKNYLNYLDKQNYEEAWKLLTPQDRDGQSQESFMKGHQGVKTIKLISLKGYSVVSGNNDNTVVYDAKVPTVYFDLVLDVVPTEGSAWGQGTNERFIMGRKGIDGEWLVSSFATSPQL
ncbi:MAG TPA: M56 family metallopeptidase [Desulfosporosinus sp.]|nr:M56 family metallopeptidase [Desulfosporosinus sp.]